MARNKTINSGFRCEITEPLIFLKNKTGYDADCFSVSEVMTNTDGMIRMREFESGAECCTLCATYNVLRNYLNSAEKEAVMTADEPSRNIEDLSTEAVRREAKRLWYRPSWGIDIMMNAPLMRRVMRRHLGRKRGKAKMRLFPSKKSLIKILDKGRPLIYSLASGYYFNHSVTVIGYRVYTNKETGKRYIFLVLNDGWTTGTRYLCWTGTGAWYLSCVTYVTRW